MDRAISLLYDDAAMLTEDLAKEIRFAKSKGSIDNLRRFTKTRVVVIEETLEAIEKLKQ